MADTRDPRIEAAEKQLAAEPLCDDWTARQVAEVATRLVEAMDREMPAVYEREGQHVMVGPVRPLDPDFTDPAHASQTDTDAVGGGER